VAKTENSHAPLIVAENQDRDRRRPSGTISAQGIVTTGLVGLLLAVSIGTTMRSVGDGSLVLVWVAVWSITSAAVGWYQRSWRWVAICPLTMVALILLWGFIFGPTYWGSTYVLMLGTTFAVPTSLGALVGTWLGRRRATH
jgi:hypothetical protein